MKYISVERASSSLKVQVFVDLSYNMILALIHSEVLSKSWMAARFLGRAEPRDRRDGWGVKELVEEVVAMDALRG